MQFFAFLYYYGTFRTELFFRRRAPKSQISDIALHSHYLTVQQRFIKRFLFGRTKRMPSLTNKYDISMAIGSEACAGILEQSMGARNRVGIGFFSYRPAWLHRLAELIPWNRFLGSLKTFKNSGSVFLPGSEGWRSRPLM